MSCPHRTLHVLRHLARALGLAPLWLACLATGPGAAASADPPAFHWERRSGAGRGTPWLAVAAARTAGGEQVVVGDRDGLASLETTGGLRREARLPGVRDLAFDGSGRLWAATLRGLFALRIGGVESPRDHGPGAGEAARAVVRVAWQGEIGIAATGQGVFASRGGDRWSRLPGSLSSLSVLAVALAPAEAGPQACGARAWVATGRDLFRASLACDPEASSGLRARVERVEPPPGRPLGEVPVDLAVDWPEAELAVLYPRHLALRRAPSRARRIADQKRPGGVEASWSTISLPLPPGARGRRLARAGGWLWIGHDRGLVRATRPDARWWRAGPPAGRAGVLALAPTASGLLTATDSGLLEGRPRPGSVDRASAAAAPAGEPDIRAVHAAAVRFLDLQPGRWRARFEGLKRRGWLPTVSLDFDVQDDSDRTRDDDQSFISGETRFLQDRDHRRGREYSGGIGLSWDLPALAYDDAWDDLSREVRQLVALRDDVLDEIDQLYFERRRVLADLAARPPDDPEAPRLALRAAELAAGIDAWTGGWFLGRLDEAPGAFPSRPTKEKQ
ncbi:MAG: hypothetical protein ACQGVK_23835 [Myxococcota bacterium]